MPVWGWVAIGWGICGCAVAAIIFAMARDSGAIFRFAGEDLSPSVIVATALIVGAPVVVVIMIGMCFVILWQGNIPLSDTAWWPSRAAKFEAKEPGGNSRESVLCRMIALRRKRDPALRGKRHPENWMMWELWETPEAGMLEVIEQYKTLEGDGLAPALIIEKIEAHRSRFGEGDMTRVSDLGDYLRYRMEIGYPQYFGFGEKMLTKVIELAETWVDEKRAQNGRNETLPSDRVVVRTG